MAKGGALTSTVDQEALRKAAVDEAYDLLRDCVVSYAREMETENALEILVDFAALWNAANSFVDDVARYQNYHKAPVPARARKAAYLCKWIMKFRPLIVRDGDKSRTEEVQTFALMANELFAMYASGGVMLFDWKELTQKICVVLLYSLRHRYNSEDTYILFFAQLCNQ